MKDRVKPTIRNTRFLVSAVIIFFSTGSPSKAEEAAFARRLPETVESERAKKLNALKEVLSEAERFERRREWQKALFTYKEVSKLGIQNFGRNWSDGVLLWKQADLLYLSGSVVKARELLNSIALPELGACTAESFGPPLGPDLSVRFANLETIKKGKALKGELLEVPVHKISLTNLYTRRTEQVEIALPNVAYNNTVSIGRPVAIIEFFLPKSWTPQSTLPTEEHYKVDFHDFHSH